MSAEPEKLGVIYNPKAGTRKVQETVERNQRIHGQQRCALRLCAVRRVRFGRASGRHPRQQRLPHHC